MQPNQIITIIIVLTAVFAYLNHRFIKWPPTIGIMVISLLCSLLLVIAGLSYPQISQKAVRLVASIDFQQLLMDFMLSFLLFAGSIHINARQLKKERLPVIVLATISTLVSTFIIGGIAWYVFAWFGFSVPFIYCLLFGALISPTDPVAILGILKDAKIPASLELKISGESLFNDGVAVVIFTTVLEIIHSGAGQVTPLSIGLLFMQEALGGVLFGVVLGYIGYQALRSIDDYKIEVLITLAIVMGGYYLAGLLHVSGPLAMVVAGIITGNKVKDEVMSDLSRDYLDKFWELIDEIFNAVLFLLMGLEMLVIKINPTILFIGCICIIVVLAARWISVLLPVLLLKRWVNFEKNVTAILTWGGLRGGISVALALSLTPAMHRDEFVPITYIIVVFSILVQGLTIGKVTQKLIST